MIIHSTLDKSFGPVGSVAGYLLFLAGLVLTCISLTGLVLVLLGAFTGFSHTCASLDPENKRVRYSTRLFGFIHTGKWITLSPGMKVGIKTVVRGWRAYSRANRPLDTVQKDYRMILSGPDGKEIMPLKKAPTQEAARKELEILSRQLGLPGIN